MPAFDHKSGKYFEIDSARIYVEDIGDKNKRPIVFLHGGMGTIEDFNALLPLLDPNFRLIGIDSRGHGKSTMGNFGLSYRILEEDVLRIIDRLELKRPILIGFSDGGITALRIASNPDNKIDKLVVIGSSWHYKYLYKTKELLGSVTAESWKTKFPETFELYQNLNPEPDFNALTAASVAMWLDDSISGHPNENVVKIDCPVLVVRGDKDHLVDLESTFGLLQLLRKGHFANVPFVGHEAHTEDFEVVGGFVCGFLRG
ncbi:alpha/beta hydrolase [Flavobacterium sp.]|uniref:alpha/beta fold hydrolase n=1 Tax=Flavobacterium sp. TaxID=239 RepID=UPI0011F43D73|nr:alpha/beta hydrolase [Flavobacterium sp.]RZJ71039.1 MAG: alpha/beta hydrolase [Flavobacterium sp.]